MSMTKKNRLHFDTILLKNGHILHCHKHPVPITEFHVVIPFGHKQSTPAVSAMNFGYAHFLEHMCLLQSKKYPSKESYNKVIAGTGSYHNAYVTDDFTDFYFRSPSITATTMVDALIDHIVAPRFTQKHVEQQRTIIANETKQNKYFPGHDQISHHIKSKWLKSQIADKKQVFGTKVILDNISPHQLRSIHRHYFNSPIHFFIGGTYETGAVMAILEKVPPPSQEYQPTRTPGQAWHPLPLHTMVDATSDAYTLYIGAKQYNYDLFDLFAVSFILDLLTDDDIGSLQQWVRHDNGWSYGTQSTFEFSRNALLWYIAIPVNSKRHIDTIRKEIAQKILSSVTNKALVVEFQKKQKLQFAFSFETLTERMDYAIFTHQSLGFIPTETDYHKWLSTVTVEELKAAYVKFFNPTVTSEFVTIPKARS